VNGDDIRRRLVDVDRQLREQCEQARCLRFGQPSPCFGDQERVGHFELPERRDDRFGVAEPIEQDWPDPSWLIQVE
jgi:hypothetical protein